MFNDQELLKISEAINGTWLLVNNQALSEIALDIFLDDVEDYPFVAVMTAIRNARKQAKGRVSIGDVMQHLNNLDGRPSAEEAWAMAVKSLDEDLTIALTQETQDAWTSGAAELLDMGDKFNASRAFIEKYNQLVTSARDQKKPISWFVSLGYNKDQREEAIRQAYKDKKITQEYARVLLPYHTVVEGVYDAIQSNVTHMIENKGASAAHHELSRVEQLKTAAEAHQQRLADLHKANGLIPPQPKKRNAFECLAVFEQAEAAQVFIDRDDKKHWLDVAGSGGNMNELQQRILAKRGQRGAA